LGINRLGNDLDFLLAGMNPSHVLGHGLGKLLRLHIEIENEFNIGLKRKISRARVTPTTAKSLKEPSNLAIILDRNADGFHQIIVVSHH
jgi:hypothetical protein